VNGARVRIRREDEIEVDGGTESPVRLQLSNVDRPVAFATPLPSEFEPACTFDPDSFSSLTVALAKFASWLRPNLMLLQVADVLVHKYASLKRSQVYHLMADSRLLGVVDLKGDVGVAPQTTSASLASAMWQPRPASAGYVPESFARRSTRLLLWEYAAHASHDVLPRRYRSSRATRPDVAAVCIQRFAASRRARTLAGAFDTQRAVRAVDRSATGDRTSPYSPVPCGFDHELRAARSAEGGSGRSCEFVAKLADVADAQHGGMAGRHCARRAARCTSCARPSVNKPGRAGSPVSGRARSPAARGR
jgi:hypothetical protein